MSQGNFRATTVAGPKSVLRAYGLTSAFSVIGGTGTGQFTVDQGFTFEARLMRLSVVLADLLTVTGTLAGTVAAGYKLGSASINLTTVEPLNLGNILCELQINQDNSQNIPIPGDAFCIDQDPFYLPEPIIIPGGTTLIAKFTSAIVSNAAWTIAAPPNLTARLTLIGSRRSNTVQ